MLAQPTRGRAATEPSLMCAIHSEYGGNRAKKNRDIFPDAPVSHIRHFQIHHAFKIGDVVSAVDLPGTSDTGPHFESRVMVLIVERNLLWNWRTWSDKRHLAHHDVQQLGQLIQARPA